MKKSSTLANSRGFISLIGLMVLVAVIALGTSVYFYKKSAHETDKAIFSDNYIENASSTQGNGNATGTSDTSNPAKLAQKCGLKILNPAIGATVSFPLQVKGIVDNRNYKAIGCSWGLFEGQAGAVEVFANINNAGWKSVSYWASNSNGPSAGFVPLMSEGNWMTSGPVDVRASIMLDPKAGKIPAGTPMKLVIEEEDPSGKGSERFEIPFTYSGENMETTILTIFKPFMDSPTDCGEVYPAVRIIPKTIAVADASMRILLEENVPDIKAYYNGVTIKNGVAIVDFDKAALGRLNSAACMQASIKSPIEKTLKQFPTIKSVEYSIDGKLFDQWDA